MSHLICLVTVFIASAMISVDDLGQNVKFRILVDKVMQPEEGWVTKEWMVKEAAETGFNVYCPRHGYNRMEEVRQVAKWCGKYGIFHMVWMRGSLRAPEGKKAEGKRMVWSIGAEQPLWSPNSDELWEWMSRYIVEYAKISLEIPSLIGVFLDYENYAPGGREGNLYSLSYDDIIMEKFAKAKGINLPKLPLDRRKKWLQEKGLHDDFERFQVKLWRERCRELRQAVDRYNPKFRFCVYPAPGTPFIVEAIYPEWATEKAPLILADACTYGRPGLLPEAESLRRNREKLLQRIEVPKRVGINFIYAGGIDPVVRGADPEFCGKNAVMISQITGGYWVFYEGPKYKVDHPDYFKWFSWANRAIAEGKLNAWHEPRQTPERLISQGIFAQAVESVKRLKPPEVTGKAVRLPKAELRGENLLLIAAEAGHPVEIKLENRPVARYRSPLFWEARDISLKTVASGTIPYRKDGFVRFTPGTAGIYLIGMTSGSCAYSIISSNVPVGLYSGRKLSFIHGVDRLYFKVPEEIKRFTIFIWGSGGETVRLNVYDPSGNRVATGQTTLKREKAEIKVDAGDLAGRTWSLQLTKADEGILEDHSIRLDPKLPPVLSLSPEHVFDSNTGSVR
ncbi:hypothetical protein J7M22_12375 [Candidatus Poribacteria bacterium]|nr:hypothetical protein [Candidatus Poribacteria bacterium]